MYVVGVVTNTRRCKLFLTHFIKKVKELISGAAGINTLISDSQFRSYLQGICSILTEDLENYESELVQTGMDSQKLEEINTDLIKLKDLLWHIEYDRILSVTLIRTNCLYLLLNY